MAHDEEFDEAQLAGDLDFGKFDLRLLSHPAVIRALGGATLASFVLFWPNLSQQIIARILEAGLVLVGLTTVWGYLRNRAEREASALVLGLGAIAAAVAIQLLAVRTEAGLGRALGIVLIITSIRSLWQVRRSSSAERDWLAIRAVASLALGLLLASYPDEMFTAAISVLAVGWLALSFIIITQSLREDSDVMGLSDSGAVVSQWLSDRPKAAEDRQGLYAKILYEGPTTYLRVTRFFILMGFASVIASMGVITDSTAVVIGAMLIAPLMTPLMGMAISLVMGWPNRLKRAATIAGVGIAWAIGIGVVLGIVFSSSLDVATNSQIQARINPTTLDLVIAVAAGAAGAFGLSRPDVSDSLPGVAISISLVPPLTVVGLAYSAGDWNAGTGALLLFLTNAVAILLIGGLTFVLTGVTPLARVAANQHRIRTTFGGLVTLALLVLGGLLINGAQIAGNALEQSKVSQAVEDWLVDYPLHSAVQTNISADRIEAVVVGPADGAPQPEELAEQMADALGRRVTADVRLIVEQRSQASSDGG